MLDQSQGGTTEVNLLIGLNCAEGVVLGGSRLLGEKVEEGGFSNVGETDDTHLQGVLGPSETDDVGRLGDDFLGRHDGGLEISCWLLLLLGRNKNYFREKTDGAKLFWAKEVLFSMEGSDQGLIAGCMQKIRIFVQESGGDNDSRTKWICPGLGAEDKEIMTYEITTRLQRTLALHLDSNSMFGIRTCILRKAKQSFEIGD